MSESLFLVDSEASTPLLPRRLCHYLNHTHPAIRLALARPSVSAPTITPPDIGLWDLLESAPAPAAAPEPEVESLTLQPGFYQGIAKPPWPAAECAPLVANHVTIDPRRHRKGEGTPRLRLGVPLAILPFPRLCTLETSSFGTQL